MNAAFWPITTFEKSDLLILSLTDANYFVAKYNNKFTKQAKYSKKKVNKKMLNAKYSNHDAIFSLIPRHLWS